MASHNKSRQLAATLKIVTYLQQRDRPWKISIMQIQSCESPLDQEMALSLASWKCGAPSLSGVKLFTECVCGFQIWG